MSDRKRKKPAAPCPGIIAGLRPEGVVVIAGMTDSGKTNLLRHIMRVYARQFHKLRVLCPTADMQKAYDCVDAKCVNTSPAPADLENIITEQKKRRERGSEVKQMVVLDDMLGHVAFRHSQVFDQIAAGSRHLGLWVIIIVQDLKALSPALRANAGYLFVTKLFEHSLESAYDLSNGFKAKKDFVEFMQQNCVNRRVVRFNKRYDAKTPYSVGDPGLAPVFRLDEPTQTEEESSSQPS